MTAAHSGDNAGSAHPYLLLCTGDWRPDAPVAGVLARERVEVASLAEASPPVLNGRPTVVVLDQMRQRQADSSLVARLVRDGATAVMLGPAESDEAPAGLPDALLSAYLEPPVGPRRLLIALRAAFRESAARLAARAAQSQSDYRTSEVTDLTAIGIRLLTQRDHDALLDLIISHALKVTRADGASLYLVEQDDSGARRLSFRVSRTESRPDLRLDRFTIPMDDSSLAGHSARSGRPLVVDDVYHLSDDVPYRFNRSFDDRSGYRTRSVLVIPMPSHSGETIGVLQLVNRKPEGIEAFRDRDEIEQRAEPFDERTVAMARALAGQAAVSLENARLHQSIERLFEGFVRASVTAIEHRDPATSGHSERVATMTCELAEAVDRVNTGPFAPIRFSRDQMRELRYAGLLHDFGKVGVREKVLVKAKKLHPAALLQVEQRHMFLKRSAELRYERERADWLERNGRDGYDAYLATLKDRLMRERARLDRFIKAVHRANEPTVLPAPDEPGLEEFERATYIGPDGQLLPFLTTDELTSLAVRQGSLDDDEWVEMRRHVTHTFDFLRNIPWTSDLLGIPNIAHGHHEKLDGSGYPRGLVGSEIPIQTRMMTIADIFDALTAADRPYKKAVPIPHALDVLSQDVRLGRLDGDLFSLFVEARIHQKGGRITA